MVIARGIEANPQQIKVVLDLKPTRTIKEVQSLTDRVLALNHFISRATDRCHVFFKLIKKARKKVK